MKFTRQFICLCLQGKGLLSSLRKVLGQVNTLAKSPAQTWRGTAPPASTGPDPAHFFSHKRQESDITSRPTAPPAVSSRSQHRAAWRPPAAVEASGGGAGAIQACCACSKMNALGSRHTRQWQTHEQPLRFFCLCQSEEAAKPPVRSKVSSCDQRWREQVDCSQCCRRWRPVQRGVLALTTKHHILMRSTEHLISHLLGTF